MIQFDFYINFRGGFMTFTRIFFGIILSACLLVACKPKLMTPEDFIKIENEVLSTDLKPESKEAIAKKYGFTYKQYADFEESLEKDPELKTKVGEIRLNIQKK
jgi:hypothetical protein